ncbi:MULTISPECIES: helix-turn-helix domain-containing protein [unclassified Colwellia]|jgi:transcriptional regulator with XRE-family HTH domain|uniref:helix-turn-helix domain-containing protein n=1 Tax=unclassified Colwellia TaxID=196834 RepID=UPI0015F720A0|nr:MULTISPECIES: helix-turn-helix transcriptional regulator [unclassified Colwellia]MBA6256465.1 helix-turn-helix transcriptional regulator [Colwellia sp. MB3u-28]MBA6260332.1 helix-turn-helix transcriptional regulator [Colwellia sp. MB3u-41]
MIKSINIEKYQKLLSWLKVERLSRGLSVRDLALIIDEPFQFISKIETGQRKLNIYEYVQYCEALGLDPAEGLKILAKKLKN